MKNQYIITFIILILGNNLYSQNLAVNLPYETYNGKQYYYVAAYSKDAVNADFKTNNSFTLDFSNLPVAVDTDVDLILTRVSINGNPTVEIHNSRERTTGSTLSVTLNSSDLNYNGNDIVDYTGIYQIILQFPGIAPITFDPQFLTIEKTKDITIVGVHYDFQIHFIDQHFDGRRADINNYLICLEHALNDSWKNQVVDWKLSKGANGDGVLGNSDDDIPSNQDNTYDIIIMGWSISAGVYFFHKGDVAPAHATIVDYNYNNSVQENIRVIYIDSNPFHVNSFDVDATQITLQELMYELVSHEFYHGIQFSHTSYVNDIHPNNLLILHWWIEGQAKAFESVFMSEPSYNTTTNNIVYATKADGNLIHKYSYEDYARDYINQHLDVNYNPRPFIDLVDQANGYYFSLFWRHIFENHFAENVNKENRLKFFTEVTKTLANESYDLTGAKKTINDGFTAVPGNFANLDEALKSFAEKVYFLDENWMNDNWVDDNGAPKANWDDPNNNNFYAAISSYAPPANVVANTTGVPDIISSISKSFAFRPHKYSFPTNGRYEITFEHDMDGDNSLVSATAYLTEIDEVLEIKDFTIPAGTKTVTLDDICITDYNLQELVLLVTRLDTDEGTKTGDYQFSNIAQALVADFDATESYTDSPSTVQFTDNSTGTIENWNWDFGDGNTSVDQNPKHEYKTSGQHTIELKVDNCASEVIENKPDYINVLPAYIQKVEIVQDGNVIQDYNRQYNAASGFSFINNGTFAAEDKELVINVTTSLPMLSLKLLIVNEKDGEYIDPKIKEPGKDTKTWTYTIPAENSNFGPRLNTLMFSGKDYSKNNLLKFKEPIVPPVFIDANLTGWNTDLDIDTGVDDNYYFYVKSTTAAPEAQSFKIINSCDEDKIVIVNNEDAAFTVDFGDGKTATLSPHSFIEHTYSAIAGIYNIKLLQAGEVKKTWNNISFVH